MKRFVVFTASFVALVALGSSPTVRAFCGFYVAKADADLFNEASQVVLVRDGKRSVITMVNDYKGDTKEFAVVIPVPTFIEEAQIHVANVAVVDHLDAYTAPRLVEYFDDDPCMPPRVRRMLPSTAALAREGQSSDAQAAGELGVTIEASYTVGEYDILILSAEQSDGLETWLRRNDYRIPDGANRVLQSYIKQGMRFFVAKVNLEEQSKLGYSVLRPIQVAYESEKFMLPIRLGTVNANGPQDLLLYALTRNGRVETTNYRTVKLPTGMDLPVHIKDEFGEFYKSMFDTQVDKESRKAVFVEYAWDMAWCDPCAADPLSRAELRELGVFWVDDGPPQGSGRNQRVAPTPAQNVFVTRLHVRYDADHFPEDLMLHQTSDRENFQGRYVLRHGFAGTMECAAADEYRQNLARRREHDAAMLASLTGWKIAEIRAKMELDTHGVNEPADADEALPWWQRLWKRGAQRRNVVKPDRMRSLVQ